MNRSPRWGLKQAINALVVTTSFTLFFSWLIAPDYVDGRRTAAIQLLQLAPAPFARLLGVLAPTEAVAQSGILSRPPPLTLTRASLEIANSGVSR
ncbi:MAG: hypothetical protein QOD06_2047 [Candidatus Binatota bacterium]|jgi:hypothetical protein|nr:hypothetical protein [Candidatus Binatota bacterium]